MALPKSRDSLVMKERPLTHYLMMALILSLLVWGAVSLYEKLSDDAEQFRFELKAERFRSSVNFVHQNWISKGRPKRMRLNFQLNPNRAERLVVIVNNRGWPLNVASEDRQLNCQSLWRFLVEDISQPIEPDNNKIEIRTQQEACQFVRIRKSGARQTIMYDLKLGKIDGPY